jgi:hypothetical protein
MGIVPKYKNKGVIAFHRKDAETANFNIFYGGENA